MLNIRKCSNELLLFILLGLFLAIAFLIAMLPEEPAKLLTPKDGWHVIGNSESKVLFSDFPDQTRQLRHSVIESKQGQLFRTWTPSAGVLPLEISSAPFKPARYMSVTFTGVDRTQEGHVHVYISCEQNDQRLDVFRGGVNTNVAEAIIVSPEKWCLSNARLILTSSENNLNAGVGSVFKISYLSYLKSSFIGRLPYFLVSLILFSIVMLTGASVAYKANLHYDSFPIALASLGIASLFIFYFSSALPGSRRWISILLIAIIIAIALTWSGRDAILKGVENLTPYAQVWGVVSLTYFAIFGLVSNGVGHWEPNYRFWPAVWSSDNELPWLFAESIRHDWDLKGLFGGGWMPTDRPPLMAGAHLLLTDAFAFLQFFNDGVYLRGQAYNAAAVALNALWAPVVWWLLKTLRKGLDFSSRISILVFLACLPFVLFNTIYGWPKAFGAAFALVAFGLAWQTRCRQLDQFQNLTILLFFILCAFSMLAHTSTALFLIPIGVFFLIGMLRNNIRSTVAGLLIAIGLLGSWSFYKSLVLPSYDPVTKYALTGDYGFGHEDWSLLQMFFSRYSQMTFFQWLEIKKIMLMQVFLPIDHSITQINLNNDFGAGFIDKLRAWDFMLISKGNLAVPFFTLVSLWLISNATFRRKNIFLGLEPFVVLIFISIASWMLITFMFLVPPILHIWPQAALFGLALGSSVIVLDRYPLVFSIILFIQLIYTGIVWVLSPIETALSIDLSAGLMLIGIGSWALILKLRSMHLPNKKPVLK